MNTKLKQELLDLAHLLHQAIITDDDRVAEAAIADMADALASILPVDHSARDGARALPSDGRACHSVTAANGKNRRFAKFNTVNACDINAISVTIPGHKIVGYVESCKRAPCEWSGTIMDNGAYVAEVCGCGRGKNFVSLVTKFAMRGVASYVGKSRRIFENKRARENSATQVNG